MPDTGAAEASTAPCGEAPSGVDTLYYDGHCPLCAKEIASLKVQRGTELALVDIHTLDGASDDPLSASAAAEAAAMPDRETLLRTLHLRRGSGEWLRGADANVAAWDGTRHGKLLRVLRWPVLRHAVDLVYVLWARWRYNRLYKNHENGAQASVEGADPHRGA